ncbi:hypothetical protein [Streptomyces bluensis]|uniref:hypothetical protein n=1 Tax=Streptomyces bluensis TaxID=33897 RepID=UPI00332F04A8
MTDVPVHTRYRTLVVRLVIHAAASDDVRLWVPVLCFLEAERERAGIVGHVGVLVDVMRVLDDD